ncbi:alpha/beta hydrolase fold-3 domain-containing protein [Bimuria novae-zelandiae CBS 107.79]|uniref:Alpha/beta hydrolase fold-3 domain-containing protein n=1 Tax=Bimuria novae-zelandiae CBS 107.79 TaxID=1447943 RepID=A0A6A5VCD1_9PLEO|nr:alpha/beta hydrolase fold-3 domain-containing protein [Bimuria novae-zelandiae CBS 107.79]
MCDFSEYGGPSEEWLAIEKTLPVPFFDFSLDPEASKALVNGGREEASAKFMEKLGPHVRTKDHTIPTRDGSTIEARSYRPVSLPEDEIAPVYLHFHGGGFLFGTLNSEDAVCANTAINAKCVVLNVNYRHTPEYTFPTAWLDSQDAFIWLHKNTNTLKVDRSKVVVGGVSAGGQLTASLVLEKQRGKNVALNRLPEIAAQVLIIPILAHHETYAEGPMKQMKSREISSIVENENAPVLPMKACYAFTSLLKIPKVELEDPKTNVLTAATADVVKGMPPTIFGVAGLDPLRDEALLYAKLLAEANVPTEVRLFKGVPHGFRRFGPALKASAQWDKAVEDGIAWAQRRPVATGKFEIKVV